MTLLTGACNHSNSTAASRHSPFGLNELCATEEGVSALRLWAVPPLTSRQWCFQHWDAFPWTQEWWEQVNTPSPHWEINSWNHVLHGCHLKILLSWCWIWYEEQKLEKKLDLGNTLINHFTPEEHGTRNGRLSFSFFLAWNHFVSPQFHWTHLRSY